MQAEPAGINQPRPEPRLNGGPVKAGALTERGHFDCAQCTDMLRMNNGLMKFSDPSEKINQGC